MDDLSLGGKKYAAVYVDEYTRFTRLYFLANKSDALQSFKTYEREMAALLGGAQVQQLHAEGEMSALLDNSLEAVRVRRLHSDQGGEYMSREFQVHCQERGILQTFAGVRAPPQNGLAERAWNTLMGTVRSMLAHSGLGKSIWAEAANTACYIITPHAIPRHRSQDALLRSAREAGAAGTSTHLRESSLRVRRPPEATEAGRPSLEGYPRGLRRAQHHRLSRLQS